MRFHSANLRRSILPKKRNGDLHPNHPFKEWFHIPWNQGFHREDSDSPNNLVSSQQLGELLRWRPFLFVRRLTGLCDFFGCWGDLFWAETLGDFFSEVLEIDNLTSQKFQSNMGWFYGSSGYIWRVKDGRFWSHVKYAKDNCWEFQKVERCRSNSTFNTYHGAATKTWTFWKFNENLLKCYTGRR